MVRTLDEFEALLQNVDLGTRIPQERKVLFACLRGASRDELSAFFGSDMPEFESRCPFGGRLKSTFVWCTS